MTRFDSLEVEAVGDSSVQVRIDFHPQCDRSLPAQMASGKTSILSILSQHFGWALALHRYSPDRSTSGELRRYFSGCHQ